MSDVRARLSEFVAQIGHLYVHLTMALYPVVVLGLEPVFNLSFGELLVLMTLGNLLFGLGSLPAGWLADRWSAPGMMVVFYAGMGAGAVYTGLATSPREIAAGLAVTGLFASIYHPVGMAWLVRTATNRARALGVNGVYGSIGLAAAGLVAGWLTDAVSWRAAFIVPGVLSLATGAVLLVLIRGGLVTSRAVALVEDAPVQRDAVIRVFVVLSITMLGTGILWSAFNAVMPKLFAERVPGLSGGTAAGAGTLVSIAYVGAGLAQYAGGHIAERFRLRSAYLLLFAVQVPLLALVAVAAGGALYGVMIAALLCSTLAVPVENSLLSRYSADRWRATLFGVKFVLSAGMSAAGVAMVGIMRDRTGDFQALFVVLALISATIVAVALFLPREDRHPVVRADPARA